MMMRTINITQCRVEDAISVFTILHNILLIPWSTVHIWIMSCFSVNIFCLNAPVFTPIILLGMTFFLNLIKLYLFSKYSYIPNSYKEIFLKADIQE